MKAGFDLLLFADESIESENITDDFPELFHGVNLKLMKSGGYFTLLKQVRQAKKQGMHVMLGCMIESSLGIARAMSVAGEVDFLDLDSFIFLDSDSYQEVFEQSGHVMASIEQ